MLSIILNTLVGMVVVVIVLALLVTICYTIGHLIDDNWPDEDKFAIGALIIMFSMVVCLLFYLVGSLIMDPHDKAQDTLPQQAEMPIYEGCR